jgi:hypothetical protein
MARGARLLNGKSSLWTASPLLAPREWASLEKNDAENPAETAGLYAN